MGLCECHTQARRVGREGAQTLISSLSYVCSIEKAKSKRLVKQRIAVSAAALLRADCGQKPLTDFVVEFG
jgi:hypothetical protein